MRKILFALIAVPSVASAQVPGTYPQQAEVPMNLDPGQSNAPKVTPPPKQQPPAQPNVIVVGPNGQVTQGAPGQATPGGPAAAPYYYGGGDPNAGMDYQSDNNDPLFAGPTPELHVVRTGDTLWDICTLYFADPFQWPKVWSYNPQVTNPHWIYPGDLIRLLPRGLFAEQQPTNTPPETGPDTKPADNLPPPQQRSAVGIKQTAFVEKSDIDKSIQVDGSVDEKELLGPGDSIYVSYPSNNVPKVGQRYSVYRPDNSVKNGGKDVGSYVRILGTVEIVSVKQDKKARAVIIDANQEIERGAKIGPLVKQYKNVPPVQPNVDAQGAIVAMLTKDQLIGTGEIIFVDLGKGSGVEVGNRMFVVRRGDALPPKSKTTVGQDDRRFPARAIGEVVIVEVGDKVSVALVTLAVQEMGVGDIVMMQKSQ
ncbi:MAG TPA: LysM peptidoglycan-binding domain-containing protein [Kofleriaceae bacterium]|nr:LysM peptidoglycan-binding domain-containing protein [Kofleriaceae bacterium]